MAEAWQPDTHPDQVPDRVRPMALEAQVRTCLKASLAKLTKIAVRPPTPQEHIRREQPVLREKPEEELALGRGLDLPDVCHKPRGHGAEELNPVRGSGGVLAGRGETPGEEVALPRQRNLVDTRPQLHEFAQFLGRDSAL